MKAIRAKEEDAKILEMDMFVDVLMELPEAVVMKVTLSIYHNYHTFVIKRTYIA